MHHACPEACELCRNIPVCSPELKAAASFVSLKIGEPDPTFEVLLASKLFLVKPKLFLGVRVERNCAPWAARCDMNDMRCPLPPWNMEKRQGWNILHMHIGLLQCQPWSLHTHAIWGRNVTPGRMEGICQCKRILCSSRNSRVKKVVFLSNPEEYDPYSHVEFLNNTRNMCNGS